AVVRGSAGGCDPLPEIGDGGLSDQACSTVRALTSDPDGPGRIIGPTGERRHSTFHLRKPKVTEHFASGRQRSQPETGSVAAEETRVHGDGSKQRTGSVENAGAATV